MNDTIPTMSRAERDGDSDAALQGILHDAIEATRRLERTHETLQREISRLRTELASKDRELERRQRLAALGELAAGVAHEVRNPLASISLYSGLLRRECSRGSAIEALALIDKIEIGVQAIDGIVEDTLALVPKCRPLTLLNVRSLLSHVAELTRPILDKHDVQIAYLEHDDCLTVAADEAGLARVLINLVSNAAEASPPRSCIRVGAEALPDERVAIRVADDGPGVPAELLHRIFDPFFTTKAQGTGLGLAIAHRLAESYGGVLSAANRAEGGAEFVVTLPARPQTPLEFTETSVAEVAA